MTRRVALCPVSVAARTLRKCIGRPRALMGCVENGLMVSASFFTPHVYGQTAWEVCTGTGNTVVNAGYPRGAASIVVAPRGPDRDFTDMELWTNQGIRQVSWTDLLGVVHQDYVQAGDWLTQRAFLGLQRINNDADLYCWLECDLSNFKTWVYMEYEFPLNFLLWNECCGPHTYPLREIFVRRDEQLMFREPHTVVVPYQENPPPDWEFMAKFMASSYRIGTLSFSLTILDVHLSDVEMSQLTGQELIQLCLTHAHSATGALVLEGMSWGGIASIEDFRVVVNGASQIEFPWGDGREIQLAMVNPWGLFADAYDWTLVSTAFGYADDPVCANAGENWTDTQSFVAPRFELQIL